MKRIIVAFGFLLLGGVTMHATAQKESGIRILSDDYNALRIELTPGTLQEGKTTLGGETFSTLTIEGYQQSLANYGDPALPILSRLIEVPLCDGFDVEVTDAIYDTLPALAHRLVPVQLPRSKSDTSAFELYMSQVYSWNAYLGVRDREKELNLREALVEAVGIARDRNLARLQFSPVRYNPRSGKVIVCRHAIVTVRYRNADESATKEMFALHHSPAFNSGSEVLNSLYPKAVRTAAPVRYLIVANSMFRGHLDSFVMWKQKKGFRVDVAYTDDPAVGTDTNSIAAYLKSLYTNATLADPAPTYVLLVGDVAQIPAFHNHIILNTRYSFHVTDLYYSNWSNGDHIPDCYYGRFSAQNIAQLTPQIEKTLMYEQYTFPDPSFLDRAVMVAGVDGGEANDYGYTHADPAMDYAITNYVNGAHGFANVYYFKNNTSIVPSGVTNVTVSSSASGNAEVVRAYYNLGAGFINYSAHGGSSGWSTPNFGNTHVNQMTNNQKFGLMIGNCCLTNKFEESSCFGETLLRKDQYAGAVGYIGGSNTTYWGEDFYWSVGVRSSINASMSMAYNSNHLGVYDRTFHTHGEAYSQWCTTQGSMLMQGDMSVESSSSSSNMKHFYWEIYHLMGDPSLMPYMTRPDTMTVTVDTAIDYGTTSLFVTAVPNAYVALTDTLTGNLIAAVFANASGNALLTLPSSLPVGKYRLAASAQQYIIAFRTIKVLQPAGPFPTVTSITSAPLTAGDTIALTLHVENVGDTIAHNITIQLASNNPLLTFSTTSVTLDSLSAGNSVDLTASVSAYVAANASDLTFVDVTSHVTWTNYTIPSISILRQWLNAPKLSLNLNPANLCILPGNSLTFTATLRNSGHAATHIQPLRFTSSTAWLTVSPETMAPFSLNYADDTTFTLTLHADTLLPQGIFVPLACEFDNFNKSIPVFIGENYYETFEGGHTNLPGWSAPAAYPWFVSTDQPYEGSYCLRSPQYTSAYMSSNMNYNITVDAPDSVSFYYRVSSESGYDKFIFLIDNTEIFNASGEGEWTHRVEPISSGTHVLTFRYSKDGSVSSGSDCAWIDNVVLPHHTREVTYLRQDVCQGGTLVFNGQTIATDVPRSGVCSSVASDSSVTIFDYAIHPTYNGDINEVTACDSYLWHDVEYTASVSLPDSLQSVYGCDSVVTLVLTINYSTVGDTAYVTANTSYEWNGEVYSASGIYQQLFTNTQGCDSTAILSLTITDPQGIDLQEADALTIYPNPTAGEVRFSTAVTEIVVYDVLGHEVLRLSNASSLDLSPLPQGIYMLRLMLPGSATTRRIVKQ